MEKYLTYIKESINENTFTIHEVQVEFGLTKMGCDYLKKITKNKKLEIESLYRKNEERHYNNLPSVTIYAMDVIRQSQHNYTFVDENGDEYEPLHTSEIKCYSDKEEYEKRKKNYKDIEEDKKRRKEESRLKMIDIDPYGEEEWENENKIYESIKPKFIYLKEILIKFPGNLALAEKAIEDLVVGETCIWYTLSNAIKNMTVTGVELSRNYQVYFNDISVDKNMKIEIIDVPKLEDYIVGFPSGEVIFLKKEQIDKLKKENLIEHFNGQSNNVFKFDDSNYHKIKISLDNSYKKPDKNKSVIESKFEYSKGDVVICQGGSKMLNFDNRIGKVINISNTSKFKDKSYLIEFLFHFSDSLHSGNGGDVGNCWWVMKENIKGIYNGNMAAHMDLKKIENEPLEEYEIDDDYHIKNLFKKK